MSVKTEKEFILYIVEQMQSVGPVNYKPMFGCYGIFLEGLMLALVNHNTLYFKADKETKHEFIEKGLETFSYKSRGKVINLSYYQAPEETLEDYNEMSLWANKAYATALRAAENKNR